MLKFISGVVCGSGITTLAQFYVSSTKLESPPGSEISQVEPLHVVMNDSTPSPSHSLAIPSTDSSLNVIGLTLGGNFVLIWVVLWEVGKILFGKKNEKREMRKEEAQQDETTKLNNSEGKIETESSIIKNLYYLGYNCNHSKLDEKIQQILNTNQLEKKVKMRQIAFESTRSLKKPTSEHANGADILLIPSGDCLFMDIPYIAMKGFGEYEISNKAIELLKQSVQINSNY
ncbi:predicted protein [Naegleria gruberi]|uniref:Predicted protein n=1 Tax=Naegleria gruberi TaxID=5762 RepID=D2VFP4_NAEGR|nr:uncharacterized protein NAEGRDRAFT_67696 [Naegleria gruberi]EFC44393.1 predicted protein [Naegleria gruberi]|eukprot:XP_002677137.1 predicted protein [Naegleria gruberi strain NEG-M]